eukprot:5894283-Alexandrium_andersonii.AAC.1
MSRIVWLACQSDLPKTDLAQNISGDAVALFDFKWLDLVADLEAPDPEDAFVGGPPRAQLQPGVSFRALLKSLRAQFARKVVGLAVVEYCNACKGVCTVLTPQERSLMSLLCNEDRSVGSVFLAVKTAV